jgi:CheY-like chemotaxis protein
MPADTTQMASSILVVEDDANARAVLIELLELNGYSAAPAANGREALERLRYAPLPALIILDLMMPEMDGWEFRRRQVSDRRLARVPVLVVSAAEQPEIDANGILTKPIDIDYLLRLVGQYAWPRPPARS